MQDVGRSWEGDKLARSYGIQNGAGKELGMQEEAGQELGGRKKLCKS
jgi:hypothetical protein